jgi:hypothetical protein
VRRPKFFGNFKKNEIIFTLTLVLLGRPAELSEQKKENEWIYAIRVVNLGDYHFAMLLENKKIIWLF